MHLPSSLQSLTGRAAVEMRAAGKVESTRPLGSCGCQLVAAVATGRGHLDIAGAIGGVERLAQGVAVRADGDHSRDHGGDHEAVLVDGPARDHLAGREVRTEVVDRGMGQVTVLVACRRHHGNPVAHGEVDGAFFRDVDIALRRVVQAVVQPWVGEVAVVGHVDVMGPCPHEGADDRIRKEVTRGIAGLDPGDSNMRGNPRESFAVVVRGRNRPRGVRAVAVVVGPGGRGSDRVSR